MPAQAPPVSDERSALVAYLVQQQDAFRAAVYGLSDAQAGIASAPPSTLTVGSLLKHVTQTQAHWLERRAGRARPPGRRPDDAGAVRRPRRGLDLARRTTRSRRRSRRTTPCAPGSSTPSAARTRTRAVPVPPAPWNPTDIDAWSVRWVWFHLIEELARHAGHADIVREGVDGATMYELVAGREGWPETDWLKPWRPPTTV